MTTAYVFVGAVILATCAALFGILQAGGAIDLIPGGWEAHYTVCDAEYTNIAEVGATPEYWLIGAHEVDRKTGQDVRYGRDEECLNYYKDREADLDELLSGSD